jgi:thiosulfate dehydrogenase [quinone] large subunit
MTEEKDLWLRDAALSDGLLRLALGLNICLHVVVRWAAGLRNFPESLLPMFQKTPLPAWSVYSFGCVLPIVEALVGACVLFGSRPCAL